MENLWHHNFVLRLSDLYTFNYHCERNICLLLQNNGFKYVWGRSWIILKPKFSWYLNNCIWNRLRVFCKFSHSAQSVFLAKRKPVKKLWRLSKNYEDDLLKLLTYQEKKIALSLKVSKFQNEFMKSSFLPKYEPKIVRMPCSLAQYRTETLGLLGFHSKIEVHKLKCLNS